MAPEIQVHTKNLTRKFGPFTAVDNVTVAVEKGEVFGFLGANGAGKTTMIRMLCGLLRPTSGTGSVAGYDLFSQNEQIKRVIGYMSQKFSLYLDLTIEENLYFYGGIYDVPARILQERVADLLERMGLTDRRRKMTRDLPVGFRQRLALASAILHEPSVIFLDEPTSGVDPRVRRQFWDLIYDLAADGRTVFVTTHFMDEAEYCNRVSIMRDGRIIAMDAPSELKKRYGLSSMDDVFRALVESGADEKEE